MGASRRNAQGEEREGVAKSDALEESVDNGGEIEG